MTQHPDSGLQLRSLIKREGIVELSLVTVPTPAPADDEVIVRIEAAPINPSDLGLLFGGADIMAATVTGPADNPVVSAPLAPPALKAMAGRAGESLPAGNEGAGVVVAAGKAAATQALLGKTVAILGGAMYAQFRVIAAGQCLVLPPGTTPAQGASCFVNPLTALGMVETMKLEGHTALVHTAAASNLGQMLVKLCLTDGIPLVNVVRRPEQVELLRSLGATYVCNSADPAFIEDLTDAIAATGATLAFDATGGGRLAGQILAAMEVAAVRAATEYSRYGSTIHKQVYIYGGLDRGPTQFERAFGMAWGIGGWLLTPFMKRIGPAAAQQLRERVAREVTTTFASTYTRQVSLPEMLSLEAIHEYGKLATGEKYLVTPQQR